MNDAEQLAQWIEEASLKMCEEGCGQPYPDEASALNGYVVVASLDGGKEYSAPCLEIYNPSEVNAWVREIRTWMQEYPDSDIVEAIYETRP